VTEDPGTGEGEGGFETGGEMNLAEAAKELRETRRVVEETHDELRYLRREVDELKESVAQGGSAGEPAEAGEPEPADAGARAGAPEEAVDAEAGAGDAEATEPESFEIGREP
jgi:hypothetical protein